MGNRFTFTTGISLCDGPVMYAASLISSDSASSKPFGRRPLCCFFDQTKPWSF